MADEPLSGLSGTFTFGYSTANVILLLDVLDTSMYTTGTDKGIPVSTFLAQYFHAGSNVTLTPGSSGVTVASSTPASLPSPFTITSGSATLLNVVPMMYTENGPSPVVASASTEVNTANQAWNAFDFNQGTAWLAGASSGWLQIDLGAGNAVVSTAYSIQATVTGDLTFMMTGWTFAGSNNGSSWTTLDTEAGITWPTNYQIQTWSFSNSTAYRYYRLTSSSNAGGAYCGVGALMVLALSTAAPLSVSSTVINVGGNLDPTIQLFGPTVITGGLTVGQGLTTYGNVTLNTVAAGDTLTVSGNTSLASLSVPGLTISSGGLTLGTSVNNAYQIGSNVQFGYASGGGSWCVNASTGDAIIRNATNRILITTGSTDYAQVICSSTGTQVLALVTTGSPLIVTGMASQTAPLLPLQQLDSSAVAQSCGVIDASFNSSTHASWTGNLLLYAGDHTANRLGIEIQSNGSVALLGHYGATPVVQPATTGTTTGTTGGSTTTLHADSTATGNSGSTAYTLGDIVLALKQLGLLTS